MICGRSEFYISPPFVISNNFYLSNLSQAKDAQSNDKVLPVPVGDSSKAFLPLEHDSITFSI